MTANGDGDCFRISDIELDDRLVVRRSAEVEHEMNVAIYDLLEGNVFRPAGVAPGPYSVRLAIRDGRSLVYDISDAQKRPLGEVSMSLRAISRVVKDYFTVCDSYFDAIRKAPPSRIEALDMGRRSLHDEGAALLRETLEGRVEIDAETSRRLFTLICVLHIRG